jgi:hypothetical protein
VTAGTALAPEVAGAAAEVEGAAGEVDTVGVTDEVVAAAGTGAGPTGPEAAGATVAELGSLETGGVKLDIKFPIDVKYFTQCIQRMPESKKSKRVNKDVSTALTSLFSGQKEKRRHKDAF